MSEDGSFYLVYTQNRSLTLQLHYNTHHMEVFDHENLFLCLFFHVFNLPRTLLPFIGSVTSFSNNCEPTSFYTETSTLFP